MQTTTQRLDNTTLQRFQIFKHLSQERTLMCFGLIILTLASAVFWSLIHFSLVSLQLPAIVGAIILFRSPRLHKTLLAEQYIGLVGFMISIIKSLCMACYIIYYLSDFFSATTEPIGINHTVTKLTVNPQREHFELFPTIISDELRNISKLFGILLIVLFGVIGFFEVMITSSIIYILKSTYKLMKIVKETDFAISIPTTTTTTTAVTTTVIQRPNAYVIMEDQPELQPAGLRRQDSAYNPLIVDEAGDVEHGRQNL